MDDRGDEFGGYVSGWRELTAHPLVADENLGHKMKSVCDTHTCYRRTKRDGNCFYSSFLSNFLDSLPSSSEEYVDLIARKFSDMNEVYKSLESGTMFEDFYEVLLSHVVLMRGDNPPKIEELNEEDMLGMITYMRLLASTELRSNESEYQPFIPKESVERYCKVHVNPLFVEADHVQIQAISNVFSVSIHVYVVSNGYTSCTKINIGSFEKAIEILNIPNHFEPICRAEPK